MAQWNLNDAASNSVSYAARLHGLGSNKTNQHANNTALFNNTTSGAFVPGIAVGQFGVSVAEMANTSGESKKISHAGWVERKAGTGPVTSLVINNGGSAYTNGDVLTISGGTTNAIATVTTNGNGVITTASFSNYGAGFLNVSSLTLAVANSTGGSTSGSGASLSATLGGRAERVSYETLVAMSSITGDASDDTQLPE